MQTNTEPLRPRFERRRFPRYEIPHGRLLPIRSSGPAHVDGECFVENFSQGGCRAHGFLPVKRGDTITAELEFSERSIYVDARVERTTPGDWTLVFVGEFRSKCPACGTLFACAFPPREDEDPLACPDCNERARPSGGGGAPWGWELGGGD